MDILYTNGYSELTGLISQVSWRGIAVQVIPKVRDQLPRLTSLQKLLRCGGQCWREQMLHPLADKYAVPGLNMDQESQPLWLLSQDVVSLWA